MERLITLKAIIEEIKNKQIDGEEAVKKVACIACKMDLTETERTVCVIIRNSMSNKTGYWKVTKSTRETLKRAELKIEEALNEN